MDNSIIELKKKIQNILDEKEKTDKNDDFYEALEKQQSHYIEILQELLLKTLSFEKNNTSDQSDQTNLEQTSELDLYLKDDPDEVPAYLFFHDSIIKKYGLCPYIHITTQDIKDNRISWLNQQDDKGELYYSLYDKIIKKSQLHIYQNEKENIEKIIEQVINVTLNDSQKQIFITLMELIYEYKNSKLKTKKIKEKYKKIIFYCNKLNDETSLNIHDYLNKKTKINVIIIPDEQKDMTSQEEMIHLNFKMHLNNYDEILIKIKSLEKYIKNTLKHTHKALEQYLKNNVSKTDTDNTTNTTTKKTFHQEGKYFKKWSLLTTEERHERFDSYVHYYISKYFNNDSELCEKMLKYIKDSYDNKHINYTSFIKWNTKKGIIEKMNHFIYEEDTKSFKFIVKETKPKKPSLPRTIFSQQNEEIINEHILTFLIKNKKESNLLDDKLKQSCFETIKKNLDLKMISKSDFIILDKKYNDIYNIIQKNNSKH